MPYIIRPPRLRSTIAACGASLLLGAAPAQAGKTSTGSTSTTTEITEVSQCVEPKLTQPFLSFGDANWYTLTPGQAVGNFEGKGWVLSGGASIKKTTLYSGASGSVLDMPGGSKAVSPNFCVTSEYPTARTFVRNVLGASGVFFNVSYLGTKTWETPKNTGQFHGEGTGAWTLPPPINMQPENTLGWQIVRLTLIAGGTSSTTSYQLYNLYIDPYVRR